MSKGKVMKKKGDGKGGGKGKVKGKGWVRGKEWRGKEKKWVEEKGR